MFRHVRTEGGSLRGAPALALLVLLAACGGGGHDGGSTASAKGKVNLLVRDAPFPYAYVDTASVVIEEIRVKNASTGVWTTVYTGPTDVDLVPLSGGNSLPLTQATLDVGTYDAVRVIVSGGEVMLAPSAFAEGGNALYTTANGRLKFPSASQSGLKVQIRPPIQVVTQLSSDLVLDFDLSRNFVFNGPVTNPPGVKSVIFTPVVRATNESMNGSIQVTVHGDNLTPGDTSDDVLLEGATVEAYQNGDLDLGGPVVATAGTDLSGMAVLSGLSPGTYDLQVLATGHAAGRIDDVTVVVANLTSTSTTLEATGELSGTVMSDAGTTVVTSDDTALAGVDVTAKVGGTSTVAGTATTDVNGEFQIAGLAAGTYDLTFTKSGFDDQTMLGVSATFGGSGLFVLMHALEQDLQVTVNQTATAVSGATVEVKNLLGDVVASDTTDASGMVTFTGVPTGTYTVHVAFVDSTSTSVSGNKTVTIVGLSTSTTATVTFSFP